MSDSISGLELRFALDKLTNQIPRTLTRDNGATEQVWDDCLLDQLDELGQGGEIGNGSHGKPGSRPPVAIDVIVLRVDIRDAIAGMWRAQPLGVTTAADLRIIVNHLIDTMQWERCDQWAARLADWAHRIADLSGAERPRARALSMRCPVCAQRWQWADTDGETVRRPIMSALFDQGVMLSLSCAACGTWQRGAELDALVSFMRAA